MYTSSYKRVRKGKICLICGKHFHNAGALRNHEKDEHLGINPIGESPLTLVLEYQDAVNGTGSWDAAQYYAQCLNHLRLVLGETNFQIVPFGQNSYGVTSYLAISMFSG